MAIDFAFEPTRKNSGYIFISYAHKDAEKVAPYVYELHRRGYEVWYDRGINALESFKDVILRRIEDCACFVAFISNNYANSSNCLSETSWATTKNIQRFPVFIEKMDKMPNNLIYDIANVQYLNAYEYSRSEAVDIIANRAYKILTGQISDWSDWNDSRVRTSAPSQQNDECGKLVQAAHYWADLYQRTGGDENLKKAREGFKEAEKAFPYDHRVWMGQIRCEAIEELEGISYFEPVNPDDKYGDPELRTAQIRTSASLSGKEELSCVVQKKLMRIKELRAHIKPEDDGKVRDKHAEYVCFLISNAHEMIKYHAQKISGAKTIFDYDYSLGALIRTITDIVDSCPSDRHIKDSVSVSELLKTRYSLQVQKDGLQPEINRLKAAEAERQRAEVERQRAEAEKQRAEEAERQAEKKALEEKKQEIEREIREKENKKKKRKQAVKNFLRILGIVLGKTALIAVIIYLIASACYLFAIFFNGNWGYGEEPYEYSYSSFERWYYSLSDTERLEYMMNVDFENIFKTEGNISLDFFEGSIEFWSAIDPMHIILPCILMSLGIVLIFWLLGYDNILVDKLTKAAIIIVYILCAIPSLPYLFNEQNDFWGMLSINVLCSILPLLLVWCLIPRHAYYAFDEPSIPSMIFAHPAIAAAVTLGEGALSLLLSIGSCMCEFFEDPFAMCR